MPKRISTTPSQPSPSNWNDGEYFKVVKLRTGELLFCTIDADVKSINTETHLTLNHPIHAVPNGETKETGDKQGVIMTGYKLKPWMDTCGDHAYTVDTNMVLTLGNMTTRIKVQYTEFVNIMKHVDANIQRQAEDIEREAALASLLLDISSNGQFEVARGDYQIVNGEHTFVPEEIHEQKNTALREEQGISSSPEETRSSSSTGEAT